MCEYNGDMILINRLSEFFAEDGWCWNENEPVKLDDIEKAMNDKQKEEAQPFGDTFKHLCMENKLTDWHIGRVIYFINHPEEIRDIEIDNLCIDNYILPSPIIVDGNHRFMAAMWLSDRGLKQKIHCRYGGRLDLLDYLSGKSDECPID